MVFAASSYPKKDGTGISIFDGFTACKTAWNNSDAPFPNTSFFSDIRSCSATAFVSSCAWISG